MKAARHGIFLSVLATASLAVAAGTGQPNDGGAVSELIRSRVELIRLGGARPQVGGATIASDAILPELYESRDFRPAWTDPANRRQMIAAIRGSSEDGLDPRSYHLDAIRAIEERASTDPASVADLDLLLTDALVRLRSHLRVGKVSPSSLEPTWNLSRPADEDPVGEIARALASGGLSEAIESYRPDSHYYVDLRSALARYRALEAAGGWEGVPEEIRRLELGAVDPRVPALRRRLAATGDLPAGLPLDSESFDAELDAAVRRFQSRHGLNADGVVGAHTVAAMNVPVGRRIDQMRVNLERGRWILHDVEGDFIAVNIAGFWVYLVRSSVPVWRSRVVVGRYQHKSPVFKASLEYVVLNPTWTVPASIARNETLPQLREDRAYLAANHMTLLDRAGNPVGLAGVDLAPGAPFPYIFRQEAGPWNALGRVKFIFPNPYSIFLHDTPSRDLFSREVRTFSHGCIRVENPIDLAEILLGGQEGWDRARIDAVLARGATTTVFLDRELPVLILYWTAWVDSEGELRFYDDVYDRDAAVLDALDRELDPPPRRP